MTQVVPSSMPSDHPPGSGSKRPALREHRASSKRRAALRLPLWSQDRHHSSSARLEDYSRWAQSCLYTPVWDTRCYQALVQGLCPTHEVLASSGRPALSCQFPPQAPRGNLQPCVWRLQKSVWTKTTPWIHRFVVTDIYMLSL